MTNYNQYYLNQVGYGNYFKGVQFQKGYGLGGVFRKFFTWVIPILRQHAVPAAKAVGEEVIRSASNFAQDALHGKNVKSSALERIDESMKNLSKRAGVQTGEGSIKRRKKRKTRSLNYYYKDIFTNEQQNSKKKTRRNRKSRRFSK
jgi:hypothetical protein